MKIKSKVLIIEPHNCIRIMYKTILIDLGYEVIAIKDGDLAIDVYDSMQVKPDLTIIDQRNSSVKSLDIISELQKRNPDNKILILGYEDRLDIERLLVTGVKIRTKPVSQKELISEIDLLMKKVEVEICGTMPPFGIQNNSFIHDEETSNNPKYDFFIGL